MLSTINIVRFKNTRNTISSPNASMANSLEYWMSMSIISLRNSSKQAQNIQTIKFPFKRNGLPCCEDKSGSEKIALK